MPSTPSTRLRVELQELGENLNTWGKDRLNDALRRLEEAIAGVTPITISGTSTVLTSTNYAADEARSAALVLTGTLTANSSVTVPNVEKIYVIINNTTQGAYSLTVKTAAGSGYALRAGPQVVYCDATDVYRGNARLDQVPVPTAAVSLGGQKITSLGTPTVSTDAATKAYVDSADTATAAAMTASAAAAAASATAAAASQAAAAGSASTSATAATASVSAATSASGFSTAASTSATAAAASATAAAASAASIAAGPVASVNTKTGAVTLYAADLSDLADETGVTRLAENLGYEVISSTGTGMTMSNGNKTFLNTSGSGRGGRSDQGKSSGKWYFEVVNDAGTSLTGVGLTKNITSNYIVTLGQTANEYAICNTTTDGFYAGSSTVVTPVAGFTPAAADVFGIAVNLDTGDFWAHRNGVWFASGDPSAGTNPGLTGVSGTCYPASNCQGTGVGHTMRLEMGEFTYAPPTGFSPWAGHHFAGNAATASLLSMGTDRTLLDSRAPLASPAFTGTPTAPTAAAATSTTQIATTAFVTTADNLKAPLASPTFTGTVTASGGTVSLTNGTSNFLTFPTTGLGVPALTTRSNGTRLVLGPTISGSLVDFAVGLDSGNFWSSIPDNTASFRYYAGTTNIATLSGAGVWTANRYVSNVATGTSPLTVTSTTVCTNLNADTVDGVHASALAQLASVNTFTAAVRGSVVALTDTSLIAVNAALGNHFSVTLAGNRTLGNPTNLVAGQVGSIIITQDATGSRTLAYSSYWKFAGGTAPVLTTTAAAVDRLDYIVVSASVIHATLVKDLK